MKNEIRLFFTAIMFYTRIPVPKWVGYSDDMLNKSTKYFPLIGWLVGGFGAGIFYLADFIFPLSISIIISMVATILLTGAFHEDGFADTCDAFGGGWTKEKILEIMKDSRIGTYGSVGLIFMLGTKFFAISSLPKEIIPFALIVSHTISRFTAANLIYFSEYARADASSKTKPVGKKMAFSHYLFAAIFAFAPFALLNDFLYLFVVIPLIPLVFFLKRYFEKWVGGFTGDCLGATQQLAEILVYLSMIIIQSATFQILFS